MLRKTFSRTQRIAFSLASTLVASAAVSGQENAPFYASQESPIATVVTPQFIALGFDDNADYEGMMFVRSILYRYRNPRGDDSHAGQRLSATFFNHCGANDTDPTLLGLWSALVHEGHEVANHSQTHPDDKINWDPLNNWMTYDDWYAEIAQCQNLIEQVYAFGGKPMPNHTGFRAPYLTYSDATFEALIANGLNYDVSLPAGITPEEDGTNNYWPHTLDDGSPSQWLAGGVWKQPINTYPGFWEIPLTSLIVPPDDLMTEFGLQYSLRDKIASRVSYFDPVSGKGDNFDWNLYFTPDWGAAGLNRDDVLAIYKYNLQLRLQGNRSPLVLGLHSNLYGLVNGSETFGTPETTTADRQYVLTEFIEYALSFPEVRFVTHTDMIDWMISPEPIISDWQMQRPYHAGDTVFFSDEVWEANWWSYNEQPTATIHSPWRIAN
ncbi:polysaccharide deacetylase family protein [Thaumasiovibrio subtropicus]|uniref:polysaccharide deacetylase family protein n=1 Tax=Thaumasiovibrio subtropicus TaxID=1891207 RepID=UPI000B360031|nr:polysaccharide deacetylase family protein [Thaumasiovibrio subtropicus]